MERLAVAITTVNLWLGRLTAWLCLGIVLLQVVIVLNRYCFGYSNLLSLDLINFEEALLYGFSAIFLFGAAYTYIEDGHVRVDIFYAGASETRKAFIDLLGNLCLLLPLVVLILLKSNRNIDLAWSTAEGSVDGGLPYVYLWLTMLPIFAISMAAQGVANAIQQSRKIARDTRLVDIAWAGLLTALAAWVLVLSLRWSLDPNWTQATPTWRFTAYALGVWFVRLSTVALMLWCLTTLARAVKHSSEQRL